MARRTTAWAALAVAALAAGSAAGAHAARSMQAADGRQLKYAAIGTEAFGDGSWAATLIEAGLEPIINQVSAPSVERISAWARESTSTF